MRRKLEVFTVFLLITVFISSATVYAGTLGVNSVIQQKSNWCWAACAEIVGKYENPTSNRTQSDAVNYIKGSSSINSTGTSGETAKAAKYISCSVADYYTTGIFSKSSVQSMINNYNNPFIVGCLYSSASGGHMLVVHGIDNNSNLYVKDPATGKSEWVSYNTLVNSYGGRYWSETVYTYFGSID